MHTRQRIHSVRCTYAGLTKSDMYEHKTSRSERQTDRQTDRQTETERERDRERQRRRQRQREETEGER